MRRRNNAIVSVLFLFPTVFAFLMIVIIPFFLGIYYSMTDWNGASSTLNFIGLQNYIGIFSNSRFLYSLKATTIFTVINVLLVNVIAFGLALLVTSKVKGRNVYRAGFFVPNLIGGIVLGYIWQFIFNNALIDLGNAAGWTFLQKSLLNNPQCAIYCVSLVATWQYAGYIMMIYVASIQGIPASLLEAASVDGANAWVRTRRILMPMMANAFTISTFLTLVNSFKIFDVNLALTDGGPSTVATFGGKIEAVKSTEFLALHIYKTAFTSNNYGEGQAKAVVFFVALVIIALLQVAYNKSREVEM